MGKSIFIAGANRGGKTVTDAAMKFLPGSLAYEEVIVSDPKANRASELADVWKVNGIRAISWKEPCEKTLEHVETDSILLSIDTIAPMAKILETSPLPTEWQLLCRGLGENGPVLGLSGTIHEGESKDRTGSINLIKELSSFIAPQSSAAIRQNPLNADYLHVMRKKVSNHSAERLMLLDREPKDLIGGALNLFWGEKSYPMMVEKTALGQRWRETKEQALTLDLPPFFNPGTSYAVATVGNKNVDFFVVEESKGRRSIRFHMPLIQALPKGSTAKGDFAMAAGIASAIGLGIAMLAIAPMMIAAPVLTAAVVTD